MDVKAGYMDWSQPPNYFKMIALLFRKRGGSVDNLLDDLADEIGPSSSHQISAESKKKSVSSKNLSLGPMEEVKITTV